MVSAWFLSILLQGSMPRSAPVHQGHIAPFFISDPKADQTEQTGRFTIFLGANSKRVKFHIKGEGTSESPFVLHMPLDAFSFVFLRLTFIMPDEDLPPEKRQNRPNAGD